MDPSLDVFHGPHRIGLKNGTITVPRELLHEIGMELGDKAQWALNPDIPGTLVLIPAVRMALLTGEILGRLRQSGT